ncbi:hypothetical protein [Brevibacterium pigmentatum]|uniref:hypothetical protein n=1 Tax=Brevibacterium pigmentatum TaxID=1496080 RepID=UPI0014234ACB|nr:hypothetical protein [Brevibacterium pigmentatum]
MGKFSYGTGDGAFTIGLDDRFLQLLERVLAEAYTLREPFRIRFDNQVDHHSLFVTDGVPVQIEHSVEDASEPTTDERKILDAMRRDLAKHRLITVTGERPRMVVYTGSSTGI